MTVQTGVPTHTQSTGSRTIAKFFWVISLLGALLGAGVGVLGFAAASGAPQEAAAAAAGCLMVIAPYVFARAIDELLR
jgi:hypothetical protein